MGSGIRLFGTVLSTNSERYTALTTQNEKLSHHPDQDPNQIPDGILGLKSLALLVMGDYNKKFFPMMLGPNIHHLGVTSMNDLTGNTKELVTKVTNFLKMVLIETAPNSKTGIQPRSIAKSKTTTNSLPTKEFIISYGLYDNHKSKHNKANTVAEKLYYMNEMGFFTKLKRHKETDLWEEIQSLDKKVREELQAAKEYLGKHGEI